MVQDVCEVVTLAFVRGAEAKVIFVPDGVVRIIGSRSSMMAARVRYASKSGSITFLSRIAKASDRMAASRPQRHFITQNNFSNAGFCGDLQHRLGNSSAPRLHESRLVTAGKRHSTYSIFNGFGDRFPYSPEPGHVRDNARQIRPDYLGPERSYCLG